MKVIKKNKAVLPPKRFPAGANAAGWLLLGFEKRTFALSGGIDPAFYLPALLFECRLLLNFVGEIILYPNMSIRNFFRHNTSPPEPGGYQMLF